MEHLGTCIYNESEIWANYCGLQKIERYPYFYRDGHKLDRMLPRVR